MLDSGSMACTLSEAIEGQLIEKGVLEEQKLDYTDVVLVGCGGSQTHPKGIYNLNMEIYGHKVVVPTLVVQGQQDDLILGTNVIKYLIHQMRDTDSYWRVISKSNSSDSQEGEQFLNMLASLCSWRGKDIPEKIGTIRLNTAVTLLPKHEHLIWGRLPSNTRVSPGCTIIVEPTMAR
nr:PREDICTED: uncharacterized protein LOC106706559 [Latimeria chalumnae]|eukprot:XP_014353167.1 PREDICTED: uncharacterized protein LOC106706559 [Latimeria chalumnae]